MINQHILAERRKKILELGFDLYRYSDGKDSRFFIIDKKLKIHYHYTSSKFYKVGAKTFNSFNYNRGWINFEDALELLNEKIKKKILFNLDLFVKRKNIFEDS